MEEILSMNPRPDFVEVITWNDAGESHYIGNIWGEGYNPQELAYGNVQDWPHFGWQSLVASFIDAFKSGKDSSSMFPASGQKPAGAMWYRTFPKNASCSEDPMGRPNGAGSAVDSVNFAVAVPTSAHGYTLVVTSGTTKLQTFTLQPGLNYAAVPGLNMGTQRADIYAPNSNTPALSAAGGHAVTSEPSLPSNICNFNFQVVPFT
ncbi:glycoside hydrolase family 71 protein [Zasmidium cellare ATCC 36951]|uniref:Glycoside hydrolase family 71 protein n=1 Tax=Zasmidium cellare ATCC 36951 TaxID=1080233 RepID=A0A6A6CVW6_ZASCE|nr:glycoside hydrolase family 71 protein [Zasmidium cellare ATCC 36951]KAF2170853.1 glycoside hydrolase family 71 protein [Zasmidium cellare ATCC 36951]